MFKLLRSYLHRIRQDFLDPVVELFSGESEYIELDGEVASHHHCGVVHLVQEHWQGKDRQLVVDGFLSAEQSTMSDEQLHVRVN